MRRTCVLAIAALLAATALAAAAGSVLWHGHTTQGYKIRAVTSPSGGLVTLLRTQYELDCSDGSTPVRRLILSRSAGDTLAVNDAGRFSVSGTVASGLRDKGSGSLTYRVSGRVRSSRITGTLRVDYALESGVRCTTELVGFALGSG